MRIKLQTVLMVTLAMLLLGSSSVFAQNWWGAVNKQFPVQIDNFTLEFDVVPRDYSVARAHITLSDTIPVDWSYNACIIRFVVVDDDDNYVDVRNGGSYEADEYYTYYEEFSYHVKMFVETEYEYYTVWVTEMPDGEEILVKESAMFRSDQAGVGQLQYVNITVPYADSTADIEDPGAELKNIVMTNEAGEVIWQDEGTNYYGGETGVAKDVVSPEAFTLLQNYPNPFNPSTTIPFRLNKNEHVTIAVYNAMGQKVATLVDEIRSAGQHQVVWNGMNQVGEKLTSGIYLIHMTTENFSVMQKALLVQ